jgi:hypothetical protein
MEAELPNFWEQESSSGYPAAPLPYPENAWRGGRKASSFSAGGLYGRPFGVSTPENDKTDKKRAVSFVTEKPQPFRAFAPARPVAAMWEARQNSTRPLQIFCRRLP